MNTYIWQSIGPFTINGNSMGTSGQVKAIACSPDFDGTGTPALFIGTRGGLWRSTDFRTATPMWTPLTDGRVDLQSARAVLVDMADPRTVYVAAESSVFSSHDGGDTFPTQWRPPPLQTDSAFIKILQHPVTGDLYAVTEYTGLHRLVAGAWQIVNTGLPASTQCLDADLVVNADGSTTFYLVRADHSDASSSGVWRCHEVTGTWEQMALDLVTVVSGTSLATNLIYNALFAVDRRVGHAGGVFLALSEFVPGTSGQSEYNDAPFINVYRLTPDGWQPSGDGIGVRFNTYSGLAFGMNDDGRLYLGGVNSWTAGVFQSDPGGTGWQSIDADKETGAKPHTDFWAWGFFNGDVYAGCDGGVYRFVRRPDGSSGPGNWTSLNTTGLRTSLAQGITRHPSSANVWLTGCQDERVLRRDETSAWRSSPGIGGDTGNVAFALGDDGVVRAYATGVSNYDFFFRSTDEGRSFADASPPDVRTQKLRAQDNAPFAVHPTSSSRIVVGTDRLFETRDAGTTWRLICEAISTTGTDGDFVTALAYGGGDSIWVAVGDRVLNTLNGGGDGSLANWIEAPAMPSAVIGLACDPRFPDVAYGVTTKHVSRCVRAGTTVFVGDVTGNVPPVRTVNAIALKPAPLMAPPMLFIGTDAGVYASFNQPGPTGWGALATGLPETDVRALEYSPAHDSLSIATYGRSAFVTSLEILEAPTVTITPPQRNSCGDPASAHASATFGSSVTDPLFGDAYTFRWITKGGTLAPGETGTNPTVTVILPAPGHVLHVVLTVTFASGFIVTTELPYIPIAPHVGLLLDLVCRLRLETKFTQFFDPLWDPLRAVLRHTPLDAKELEAIGVGLDHLSSIIAEALRDQS